MTPNKRILVKIRLQKVDLSEFYIQKEQKNFKKRSSSNTIGGPLHMSPPVHLLKISKISSKIVRAVVTHQSVWVLWMEILILVLT